MLFGRIRLRTRRKNSCFSRLCNSFYLQDLCGVEVGNDAVEVDSPEVTKGEVVVSLVPSPFSSSFRLRSPLKFVKSSSAVALAESSGKETYVATWVTFTFFRPFAFIVTVLVAFGVLDASTILRLTTL